MIQVESRNSRNIYVVTQYEIGLNVENLRNYNHFNTYFCILTQSEPMEFSKNGIFHSKSVVIIFSK